MRSKNSTLWRAKVKALKVERRQWQKVLSGAVRKMLKINEQIAKLESKIEYQLAKTK